MSSVFLWTEGQICPPAITSALMSSAEAVWRQCCSGLLFHRSQVGQPEPLHHDSHRPANTFVVGGTTVQQGHKWDYYCLTKQQTQGFGNHFSKDIMRKRLKQTEVLPILFLPNGQMLFVQQQHLSELGFISIFFIL